MGILYEKLKNYRNSDYYGFHMPGHKRNPVFADILPGCEMDITEISGFDDLHHAEGILRGAQEAAASVFHADETHFLVNGSTVGILSAVLGVTNKHDTILVARNCHKSVYHAIYMNELDPVYVYPGFNTKFQLNTEICAEDVKNALDKEPKIRAVILVSPTYDGVVSDIGIIAEAAHKKGIPLIVDEAHGAHFGFHSYFPENANEKGADIVIHSVHKTLPSLTQTALLHMNGSLVERERVRRYLHMLQSSSPSYLLMSGLDSCVNILQKKSNELFLPYVDMLKKTRRKLAELKRIDIFPGKGSYDRSKIVISTRKTDMSGRRLEKLLLKKYHLQMEMAAGSYVLAMTSVGDRPEGFERLVKALTEIDKEIDIRMEREENATKDCVTENWQPVRGCKVYTSSQILLVEDEIKRSKKTGQIQSLKWEESTGYISLEYAYLYPPGIPLIVPGELITEEAAALIRQYREAGFSVEGPACVDRIKVCKERLF
ncbi:aminotransferase class I/II-fold pyridoxal phosphate-dependent enzyme [Lachnospiraceae bacterium 42-17]